MRRQCEANRLSLRIAYMADMAVEAAENRHFSIEVLAEQGRIDPKISIPPREILFQHYSYEYSILLYSHLNYTTKWNIIPYHELHEPNTYTCNLVKRNRTRHPVILAHTFVIWHPERSTGDPHLRPEITPLRDKRWLSRSALSPLDNFGFRRSSGMHKSSEFVSSADLSKVDAETGKSRSPSIDLGVTCHLESEIARRDLTGRDQVVASTDRVSKAPEMRALKQYELPEVSARSLRKVDRGIGSVKPVREYLRRESPEMRGCRTVEQRGPVG